MTEPAAIQGTFADLKSVKTRSVVQMVVEIPIEQAEQVIKAFGFPQPGAEVMVAVARLVPEKTKPQPAAPEAPEKPKVPFHKKPLSVQAGIRCSDPRFRDFLFDRHDLYDDDAAGAAKFVREHCEVTSRAHLGDGNSDQKWQDLNAEFEKWAGLVPEER